MAFVVLKRPMPLVQQKPGENDCGPHAIAMAAGYFGSVDSDRERIALEIRFLRVPWLGATLPWAIGYALRRRGLDASGGWFTKFSTLRRHLAADRPVIVIVRPTDLFGAPSYALHYRVAIGYQDDPSSHGGGTIFFNCSATPPRAAGDANPGNLTVDYATFRRQWRTYITLNWGLAVIPRTV